MSKKLVDGLILSSMKYNYIDFRKIYGNEKSAECMARIFKNDFLDNQSIIEDWYKNLMGISNE